MKIISALLLIGLTLLNQMALAGTPGEVEVGAVLREARLDSLTGSERKLSQYRGKPLLINVWASWCGPCREEMPSIERLARSPTGKQFNVIGVSTDDYRDRAQAFLRQYKTSFSHFIDHDLALENMLGADRLPLTLLVDAQGRVLAKFAGAKEWDSAPAVALINKTFALKR